MQWANVSVVSIIQLCPDSPLTPLKKLLQVFMLGGALLSGCCVAKTMAGGQSGKDSGKSQSCGHVSLTESWSTICLWVTSMDT